MRTCVGMLFLGLMASQGCAHKAPATAQTSVPPAGGAAEGPVASSKLIVTPETGLVGKVVQVNMAGRFMILNFPIGHLPAIDQRLYLYRLGLRVGEVKICGPQRDDNIVADLVSGEAAVGDHVRDQ